MFTKLGSCTNSDYTADTPASLGVLLVDDCGSEEICINMDLIKEGLVLLDVIESKQESGTR